MTDNIKPLFPGQRTGIEPVDELIAMTEDLAARARSGELRSLAFAGCCADNTVMSGISVAGDVFALIGGLRVVESVLVNKVDA